MKVIITLLLPYLPAADRLRLSQAASRDVRQLILSDYWERQAMMEYLKFSHLGSVIDTWKKPPLALPWGVRHRRSLYAHCLQQMRRGVKTWHSVCARSVKRWRVYKADFPYVRGKGRQKTFSEMAEEEDAQRLMTETQAWDLVASKFASVHLSRGEEKVILLLRSGFPVEQLMSIPPMDVIYWCGGIQVAGSRVGSLPPVCEVWKYVEPAMEYIGVHEFFTWKYATQPGLRRESVCVGPLDRASTQWTRALVREAVEPAAREAGFRPCVDNWRNEGFKMVLFEHDLDYKEVRIYGETVCRIPLT
eukprot:Blabericola_migrator_1__813@NODE_11_length_24785_cov_110_100736_g8_i0_p12_GENE_NODE_11_length_24785_cov_110_100736_g8_i0NODE_11_length_24785_cov_110_100736_g8_i0_p12_ORF_typecomplete_len304_score36_69_NODE_11_length_24785_cov_110_100736_g8_i019342845